MMMHLLLVVFVQFGSTQPQHTSAVVKGPFPPDVCSTLALRESKLLPLEPGDDARWQSAECVQLLSIKAPTPITEWRYP